MKKFALALTFNAAAVGALTAGALCQSGAAVAAPTGGGSAADVAMSLMDQGYTVQLNGTVIGPLSRCTVKDVHGLSGTTPGQFDVVYLDVSCPGSNN